MNGIPLIPKIFAFIQARLGSSRYPNKILKQIPENGMSLLEHIHSRLIQILPPEQIVFLIPKDDEPLVEYLSQKKFNYFRGDLNDVRRRYIEASEYYKADVILRLTGDNPFVDIRSIETIIDTWKLSYYKSQKVDLIYYTPLPLGMGIESFTKDALLDFQSLNEDRHREHVSLHIKENPNHFRIIKLPSPFPDNLVNLRLTFDEELDYQTLLRVYEECIQKFSNHNFGALEIYKLSLDNPELFVLNQSVNQVKFSLPKKEDMGKKSVLIVVGHPFEYGFGHWERMNVLACELSLLNYEVRMKFNSNYESIDSHLCIIDSREDFAKVQLPCPALKIDELSPQRFNLREKDELFKEGFIDLLPHPNSYDWKHQPEILIHPNIEFELKSTIEEINGSKVASNSNHYSSDNKEIILCYAGACNKELSDNIDEYLCNFFYNCKIIRVGGTSSDFKQIIYEQRISKSLWWNYLKNANFFLSYFGQGLMEAMFLRKKVASYSIGNYHSMLSSYIENIWGVPFLGDAQQVLTNQEFNDKYPILNNTAQERIIQWLEIQSY